MPIKLVPSKRASAAIASIVAMAVGGWATLPSGYKVHDDTALAIKYLTGPWEGRRLVAYLDTLPNPDRWTICDGDTTDVKPGQVETNEGCDKRVAVKMERDYRPKLVACVPDWDNHPLGWRGAMLDLSWNIGPGATCNSTAIQVVKTAVKLKKTPDYKASCGYATLYIKSGGRTYDGLVKRRGMGDASRIGDGEMCMSGL
ncbi:GH24 family phage-related lysozyme (muramidase) [Rhizobium sp. BK316]|uniref:glycoside hydrolase family protein n=1 Tax=Rhizobium sp. BK316 TaxID=2587053 RepID=UPI00161BB5D9|nr:glycoside hydrolase [Rhizobium sp. BK316]MBB3411187.1 GH24 family phage-related lysozyme (muramidase) [Rhizobium sp. BK316]